jgi:hypothetical protein
MRATYSPSTCGIHDMSLRHGLRSFSAKRRRTAFREMLPYSVSWTSSPTNSSKVQRARPSGGLEQAVATKQGFFFPGELTLRSRAWLLGTAAKLSSIKQQLGPIDGRAAHPTLLAMGFIADAHIGSQQNRLSLRTECFPPLSSPVSFSRSAWLSSTR